MQEQKPSILIPLSIIIAGALIAGGIYYTKHTNSNAALLQQMAAVGQHPEENIPAVVPTEHIYGDPSAPIQIVEYSDTDCPFCGTFQTTMKQIVDEYAKTGKVAWVYRHFSFHPNAPKEAQATECAAELGGNDKFWEYLDLLYESKNFNKTPYVGLDPKQLPVLAASVGINEQAFKQCLDSGKYKSKIDASYQEAIKSGAQGTPYTVIISPSGKVPITVGAVPYQSLKSAIEAILSQN